MRIVEHIAEVILVIVAIVMFFPPICKLVDDFWRPLIMSLLGQ